MTDTEKIQAVLNEAIAGAGAMISVGILCSLVRWRLKEQPEPTIVNMQDFIDTIITTSNRLADTPDAWSTNGHNNLSFTPPEHPQQRQIEVKLRNVIAQMEVAYKDDFRINGAIKLLRDVAKYGALFQSELEAE